MKSWGIENPAPQRIPAPLLTSLYEKIYENFDALSDDGGDLYTSYQEMFKEAYEKNYLTCGAGKVVAGKELRVTAPNSTAAVERRIHIRG